MSEEQKQLANQCFKCAIAADKVRELQKKYFKTRDKEVLRLCKEKEAELDKQLDTLNKMLLEQSKNR